MKAQGRLSCARCVGHRIHQQTELRAHLRVAGEVAMLALRAVRPRSAGGQNRRAQGENSSAPLHAARRIAARARSTTVDTKDYPAAGAVAEAVSATGTEGVAGAGR